MWVLPISFLCSSPTLRISLSAAHCCIPVPCTHTSDIYWMLNEWMNNFVKYVAEVKVHVSMERVLICQSGSWTRHEVHPQGKFFVGACRRPTVFWCSQRPAVRFLAVLSRILHLRQWQKTHEGVAILLHNVLELFIYSSEIKVNFHFIFWLSGTWISSDSYHLKVQWQSFNLVAVSNN